MKFTKSGVTFAIGLLFSATAFAQTAGTEVQRNINQQTRIQQGLESGELTTREAAKLERQEGKVEKMQSNAMKDGVLTPQEKERIQRAQNKTSTDIYREKHDAKVGNPNSPSSTLMQADVQRNINQQERIKQGIQSGELTNKEVGKLERGQARVNRVEARTAADGHVGPNDVARVQRAENRQSRRIYREKHDGQTRQ